MIAPTNKILVLGLGNVLMGDDAFGPYVIARLVAKYLPTPGVDIEDLGTPGLNLHPFLLDRDTVIIVDTVRADDPPGWLRLYDRDEILSHTPKTRTSPHDPGLKEALLALEFVGRGPTKVLLVGAIPERVDNRLGLSTAVQNAVDLAELAIVDELDRLGKPLLLREKPLIPNLWWEDSKRPRSEMRG